MIGPRHIIAFVFVISVSPISGSSQVDNLRYVGCFNSGYALGQKYQHYITSVTLTKCLQYCHELKTRFIALQVSDNFCYCGGDIAERSVQRNTSLCNDPCPDEPLRTCGGDWLISLYDTQGASGKDAIDDVNFLLGIRNGVRLYDSRNSSAYDTLMTLNPKDSDWVYSVDYHFTKNLIFAHSLGKLFKTSLKPPTQLTLGATQVVQVVKNDSSCNGFAVDWLHDLIYRATCDSGGTAWIVSFGLNGEAEQTVLADLSDTIIELDRMEIDPFKGILFWIADGVIQSVETSGEGFNPDVIENSVRGVKELTLDLSLRRVYFVGRASSLYSMDYTGDAMVKHFSSKQLWMVHGLGILGNKVFWESMANGRDIIYVIYEAPLNLTRVEDVKVIKKMDKLVKAMRVVHPSLQRRLKIDPCLDKGNSCLADNSNTTTTTTTTTTSTSTTTITPTTTTKLTTVKSKCPPGQALHIDGVSCQILVRPEDRTSAAAMSSSAILADPPAVFLGILLIVGVILTSLVCVGYKYWSLLQRTRLGIPYSRSLGQERGEEMVAGTTEYLTGEDI